MKRHVRGSARQTNGVTLRRGRAGGTVLSVMALIGAAGCQGRTAGPPGTRPVQLTDVGGYLEFVTRQRKQNQESKVGTGDTRMKETIFEENVKLELEGYSYHPNFLEFALGGLFGLLQEDFQDSYAGRDRQSGDDGTVYEFDLRGDFFKKKSYPGSVFARRYQGLEPRPFLSSLQTTTTNYGVVWQYVDEKMPTNFQFNSTDVRLEPLDEKEEPGRQQNTYGRFETAYRFSDHNALSLLYTRQSVKEEPFHLDYDSDELTLGHRLDFGEGHRHRLESEYNYFNQEGTFSIKRNRLREILRFQHTDKLRSWYQLELTDREQGSQSGVPPIKERSFYLAGTVEHELFESLVTQLFGYTQLQRYENGLDVDRLGGQLSLDYRKKNPWGVLTGDYRFRLETEDRSGADQRMEVLDERHTFQDPEPIVLANTNVDATSILITAEDRITFYVSGRDYTMRTVGDRLEIERVPTGRILDGQTVLIDYVFKIGGNFTLDTTNHFFSLRQDFEFGLSPYYRLRRQDQTLSPEQATGVVPEDITDHVIGAEFERWSFRLMAEYESYDSTITPYTAVRLGADYTHRFKFGATGIVKTRWSDFNYDPPNERQTEFFTIEGRYRHPITPHLTVEAAVLYREEDDSLNGPDEGVELDFTLEWIIRQTEVRVTYEQGQFEDNFSRNDNSRLWVQVKRRF